MPKLTRIGRRLARLPVDPRLGRMLIEADRLGSLREVVVITAALSMQDPRERPSEEQEKADQMHARFADPTSDFAGMLNLWRYLEEQQAELSSSAFRRMCKRSYLSYLRVREWQDLEAQLRQVSGQLGLSLSNAPSSREPIHKALLAGLLSHIGMRDSERRDYLGARGTRFALFPGSALFKKPPEYVMAAELVETSRLWGRVNAAIEPGWAEEIGASLVRRTYSEPHWSARRGAAMTLEKVTLYGVPLATERPVLLSRVDPRAARELFIRHALVQGEWRTHHAFWAHNQALLDEVADLENRARRRDIVVDEETLVDFYEQRIPDDVVSVAHFDAWWKKERRSHPQLLDFTVEMLTADVADHVSFEDYPTSWQHGDTTLPLEYTFEPGSERDGVAVDVPAAVLESVTPGDFSWPVPGLREDLVVALLRSLPKRLRVAFVPAPDHARRFLESVTPGQEPLLDALERYLLRSTGHVVPRDAWDLDRVPAHLRMTFRVRDDEGDVLAEGKDLAALQEQVTGQLAAAGPVGQASERTGMTTWEYDVVPREIDEVRAGHRVLGYPAFVDEGDSVALRVFPDAARQEVHMRRGVRRLVALAVPSPGERVVAGWDNAAKLTLGLAPHRSIADLLADCWTAAVGSIVDAHPVAWDRAAFESLVAEVTERRTEVMSAVLDAIRAALSAWQDVDRRLSGRADLAQLAARSDLIRQRDRLVHPGFVAEAGLVALRSYPRYFAAMQVRLDKLAADVRRDSVLMASMAAAQDGYDNRVAALPPGDPPGPALVAIRWMLEELRVSLWAQQLGTAEPVSVQRVAKALASV